MMDQYQAFYEGVAMVQRASLLGQPARQAAKNRAFMLTYGLPQPVKLTLKGKQGDGRSGNAGRKQESANPLN